MARPGRADPRGPVEPVGHLGVAQDARPARGGAAAERPPTIDELRIAHNAASSETTPRRDAALRARSGGARPAARGRFDGDTTLIGGVHHRGARRSLTLFFVAGKIDGDAQFTVHAKVARPPRLSTLPAIPPIWRCVGADLADDALARGAHLSPRDRLPKAPGHRAAHRRVEPGAAPDRQRGAGLWS